VCFTRAFIILFYGIKLRRSLRRILGIRWYDKTSNVELWKATDQESAEVLLKRRRWTWIGHTLRKLRDNIARRALQWNPQGQRNRGRPKNTWRRGVEQEMKEAGVKWGSLEAAAQDRAKWKQFVGGLCSTSGVTKA